MTADDFTPDHDLALVQLDALLEAVDQRLAELVHDREMLAAQAEASE